MKMLLFSSRTSPFARKVRIAVEELQLSSLVEQRFVDPFAPSAELLAANPLAQIPTLVTEKGQSLPGSELIVEYLQTRGHGLTSLPRGSQRWAALRRLQLADGMIEAAVSMLLESRRPAGNQYPPWIERKREALRRSLDALEQDAGRLIEDVPSVVEIAVAAALGYLDFRFPDLAWREGRRGLHSWYETFASRPSMQATQPVAA